MKKFKESTIPKSTMDKTSISLLLLNIAIDLAEWLLYVSNSILILT
tara:strand:+ start:583 stop:720 length:138 start_codon:yes stop_codon:yes gene_type:complete